MKKLKEHGKYEIIWKDTFSLSGWRDKDQAYKEAKRNEWYIATIGYYVGENAGYIITCSTLSSLSELIPYGNLNFIPLSTVKSVKLLKY